MTYITIRFLSMCVLWVFWHQCGSTFCCVTEAQVHLFIFCCRAELLGILTVLSSVIVKMLDIKIMACLCVVLCSEKAVTLSLYINPCGSELSPECCERVIFDIGFYLININIFLCFRPSKIVIHLTLMYSPPFTMYWEIQARHRNMAQVLRSSPTNSPNCTNTAVLCHRGHVTVNFRLYNTHFVFLSPLLDLILSC